MISRHSNVSCWSCLRQNLKHFGLGLGPMHFRPCIFLGKIHLVLGLGSLCLGQRFGSCNISSSFCLRVRTFHFDLISVLETCVLGLVLVSAWKIWCTIFYNTCGMCENAAVFVSGSIQVQWSVWCTVAQTAVRCVKQCWSQSVAAQLVSWQSVAVTPLLHVKSTRSLSATFHV